MKLSKKFDKIKTSEEEESEVPVDSITISPIRAIKSEIVTDT